MIKSNDDLRAKEEFCLNYINSGFVNKLRNNKKMNNILKELEDYYKKRVKENLDKLDMLIIKYKDHKELYEVLKKMRYEINISKYHSYMYDMNLSQIKSQQIKTIYDSYMQNKINYSFSKVQLENAEVMIECYAPEEHKKTPPKKDKTMVKEMKIMKGLPVYR